MRATSCPYPCDRHGALCEHAAHSAGRVLADAFELDVPRDEHPHGEFHFGCVGSSPVHCERASGVARRAEQDRSVLPWFENYFGGWVGYWAGHWVAGVLRVAIAGAFQIPHRSADGRRKENWND